VGRSPDISVMWRTEYYAGAGYIRHVAVKRLNQSLPKLTYFKSGHRSNKLLELFL